MMVEGSYGGGVDNSMGLSLNKNRIHRAAVAEEGGGARYSGFRLKFIHYTPQSKLKRRRARPSSEDPVEQLEIRTLVEGGGEGIVSRKIERQEPEGQP